jgi:diguanylate cyclase (GGDEF)-like protein
VAPIHLLVAAVAASALALALGVVVRLDHPSAPRNLPWWLLAGGFLAAERFLVHIPARRTAHTLTFAELPLVLGLFFAAPATVLVAQAVGAGLALLLERDMSWTRRAFNLSQYGLTSGVTLVVFHDLRAGEAGMSVVSWAAAMAAIAVACLAGVGLIVAAMTVTGDPPERTKVGHMLAAGMTVSVTNTSLALLAAFVAWYDAQAMGLLAIPVAVVFLSYRAYVAQHRHAEQVEFLNRATRDLVAARSVEDGLARLLDHSLAAFHCRFAELVLFSGEPAEAGTEGIVRVTRRDDLVGTLQPVTGDDATRLAALAGGGPLLEGLAEYLAHRSIGEALGARLVDDDGVLGVLLVGEPIDGAGRLGRGEARLLDTLANQASTVLRYERLEAAFTRLHAEQVRIQHDALHDPVTGLGNRRLLGLRLGEAVEQARPVAVMLVDLDDFKVVNDTLGHAAGDELLVAVGQRMRRNVRPDDLVVRLGGDEFAVLLFDRDSQDEAVAVAERVLAALTQPYTVHGHAALVGASIGLVTSGEPAIGAAELVDRADQAMYEAKRAGKCQVRRWDASRLPAA